MLSVLLIVELSLNSRWIVQPITHCIAPLCCSSNGSLLFGLYLSRWLALLQKNTSKEWALSTYNQLDYFIQFKNPLVEQCLYTPLHIEGGPKKYTTALAIQIHEYVRMVDIFDKWLLMGTNLISTNFEERLLEKNFRGTVMCC